MIMVKEQINSPLLYCDHNGNWVDDLKQARHFSMSEPELAIWENNFSTHFEHDDENGDPIVISLRPSVGPFAGSERVTIMPPSNLGAIIMTPIFPDDKKNSIVLHNFKRIHRCGYDPHTGALIWWETCDADAYSGLTTNKIRTHSNPDETMLKMSGYDEYMIDGFEGLYWTNGRAAIDALHIWIHGIVIRMFDFFDRICRR